MKHKTAELEGALLDAAVAKAEGLEFWINPGHEGGDASCVVGAHKAYDWCPSTEWEQGGPIIEREQIGVHPVCGIWNAKWPKASRREPTFEVCLGGTPLIAAMRAFVASKLGEEVDL